MSEEIKKCEYCFPGCTCSIAKFQYSQCQDTRLWEFNLTSPQPDIWSSSGAWKFFINEETGKILITGGPFFIEYLKYIALKEFFAKHDMEYLFLDRDTKVYIDIDSMIEKLDCGDRTKTLREFALKQLENIREWRKKEREEANRLAAMPIEDLLNKPYKEER